MDLQKYLPYLLKYKWPIVLGLSGLILIAYSIATSVMGNNETTSLQEEANTNKDSSKNISNDVVYVDIEGGIKSPGVYKLPSGARVGEALQRAGGLGEQANRDWVSKHINLAVKITDGAKIYIPFEKEQNISAQIESSLLTSGDTSNLENSKTVNINTASSDALDALSGIGPVTAKRIIDSRPYQSIDELLSRKILSAKVYSKIKAQLVAN